MQLLLLLLLAGVCCGLQYPLQYHYHYRARVTAGIPQINSKHSGAADIRADLKVYVTSPSTVIFKLEQVEFAEYNGELECDGDLDQPLPVEYQTAWEPPASQLGQSVFGIENGTIIVNEEDDQWVINFYKSIINLFNIAPLKSTFTGVGPSYTHNGAYSVVEGSTMGMCNSTYTQHKLSGVAAVEHQLFFNKHVTSDVQTGVAGDLKAPAKGSKTTDRKTRSTSRKTRSPSSKTPRKGTKAPPAPIVRGPAISSTVWQVMRSVSLKDCESRVEHQHSLGGVYCELAGDQCENLFSRNSQGVYWVRGDAQGMRLELAVVRGAIVISPYGYETEHLQTLTKQKLALVSVSSLSSNAPNLNSFERRSSPSVLYEMTLPYQQIPRASSLNLWAKPGTMKETMRNFHVLEVTGEMQRANEQRVVSMISWAGEQLEAGTGAQVPVTLNYAAILLYEFTEDELARVEAAVPAKYKDLFWGVLTEVGYAPAVRRLVVAMTRGDLTPLRQSLVFGMLNINMKSAAGLLPLLEFVLSQDLDASPFRSSQSLVNLASLVNRMCGSGRGKSDSFTVIAREQCQRDRVQSRLEDYIGAQLQSTDKFWKQMVLVRALLNLKTLKAYTSLLPYVLGVKQCDPMLRAVAMESLTQWKAIGIISQSKATLILLDILENPGEGRLIRARALGYLVSWPLSSSTWARLAFTTRRPRLRDLAAFTYSIIRATADYQHPDAIQQRQFARHALQLAKPSSAADRHSSYNTWFKYNFADQFGSIDHLNLIRDPTSPLPAEVSLFMKRTLGGLVVYKKAELLLSHDTGNVMQIVQQLLQGAGGPKTDSSASGQWTNFIRSLGGDLHIQEKVRELVDGMLDVELMAGMQFFVPFEHEMIIDVLKSLSSEQSATRFNGPKSFYMNPADISFVTVNDMGLPILTNVGRPTVLHFAGTVDGKQDSPTTFSLKVEKKTAAHVYSSYHRTHLETVVPWSRSKISTGASKLDTATLPFEFSVSLQLPSVTSPSCSLTLRVNPTVFDKVSIISRLSRPYILIRDTTPANLQAVMEHVKTVYADDSLLPIHRSEVTEMPLSLQYWYEGDRVPPSLNKMYYTLFFGKEDFVKLMLSPTVKYYQQDLIMDLTGSQSSFLSFNVTGVTSGFNANEGSKYSIYGKDSFEEYELCGQKAEDIITQQTGQQSTDDDYWDQQSAQTHQNADSEFSDFSSFGQQHQQQSERLYRAETEAETTRPSQGVGDGKTPLLAPLLRYLERQAGWKSRIDSFSIRVGLKDRDGILHHLEAVGASTVCYNLKDQMETKRVFAVVEASDPCFTTCMESVEVQPKLNDLDTLELIWAKNLSRTTEASFYSGAHCSGGPFATVTDKRELTEAGAAQLLAELQHLQSCRDEPVDPVAEFHHLAQYDLVTVDSTYRQSEVPECSKMPKLFWPMIRAWNKLVKLPLFEQCEVDTGVNTYHGTAERQTDKRWKVTQQFDSKDMPVVFRDYPYWVEYVNYLTRNSEYQWADYCVIDTRSVTTFDGLRVNTSVAECPVLAATSCESGQFDKFAVSVNKNRNGGMVVNIGAQYKQQVINIDDNGVTINRVRMDPSLAVQALYSSTGERKKLVGHVYSRNGFYKVQLDDTLSVILKEGRVYIEVADRYRGYSCGLCGNLDQNPSNDLVAPNGCLLTQPATFATSWTPSTGVNCFAEQQSSSDSCFKEEPLPADYYQQHNLT